MFKNNVRILILSLTSLIALAGCGRAFQPKTASIEQSSQEPADLKQAQVKTCNSPFPGQPPLISGDGVTAFAVDADQNCLSEFRLCEDGRLTGSYTLEKCPAPNVPIFCVLPNGLKIADGTTADVDVPDPSGKTCGDTVTYQCTRGSIDILKSVPILCPELKECKFNDQTIASGRDIKAYRVAQVIAPASCEDGENKEQRLCLNGVLSGSFEFAQCTVVPGTRSCELDGQTIAHGASIPAFNRRQATETESCHGKNSISRTCVDGTLTGSNEYKFAFCAEVQPKPCLFDGQTLTNGQVITAYKSKSVAPDEKCEAAANTTQRQCLNGVVTGDSNFAFASCHVRAARSCELPTGGLIAHGQSIKLYKDFLLSALHSCEESDNVRVRTCVDGTLSGSSDYKYASCQVRAPLACVLDGQTIAHGQFVTAFRDKLVAFGQNCSADGNTIQRQCLNGELTGNTSYAFASCRVREPRSCELPSGGLIAHGQSYKLYKDHMVTILQSCESAENVRWRACNDGSLSGSDDYKYASCIQRPMKSCTLPWGEVLAHGASVTAFAEAPSNQIGVKCQDLKVTRTCDDGDLTGPSRYNLPSCPLPSKP